MFCTNIDISNQCVTHRPNNQLATALITETNLGVRASDIVKLRMCDIVKDGSHYRLDIIEQKTSKKRKFPVHPNFYTYLVEYCNKHNIGPQARIFPITTRNLQKLLKPLGEYLNIERFSTHSCRKFAGQSLYESSGHNINLVCEFLQQSDTKTTMAYLNLSSAELEKELENHCILM